MVKMLASLTSDRDLVAMLSTMKTEFNRRVIRSSVYAGVQVYIERSQELARVYKGPPKYYKSGKPVVPGALKKSIYHAHTPEMSNDMHQVYSVSWNTKEIGYGYLIEYGHIVKRVKGGEVLGFAPPYSFIRAAEDSLPRVFYAVERRAYRRFDELLPLLDKAGNLPEFKPEVGS